MSVLYPVTIDVFCTDLAKCVRMYTLTPQGQEGNIHNHTKL